MARIVCLAQTSVLPCSWFQTMTPRQAPSSVSRSIVKVSCQTSTCSSRTRRSVTARMTSLPVASPKAWTMRSCPWPPSRPRARRPSAVSKRVPQADQFLDPPRGLADHPLHDLGIAERAAGLRACRPRGLRSGLPDRSRRRCRPGQRSCWRFCRPSLVTTRTESCGSVPKAARIPASPPPMISTSVK